MSNIIFTKHSLYFFLLGLRKDHVLTK